MFVSGYRGLGDCHALNQEREPRVQWRRFAGRRPALTESGFRHTILSK